MVATYQRLVAAFGLLLGGVTWRLWVPQQDFPQVPLFRWALSINPVVDWILLAVAVVALMGMLIYALPSRRQAISCLTLAITVSLLIALNQHRCQPWAYQFILLAAVFALTPKASSVGWLRIFAISIYAYSALGKFDYQFLHTVGQQFLGAFAGQLGIDLGQWPSAIRLLLAASLPTVELAIALGLAFEHTRRIACFGAVLMHALLILILGPTGLGHENGVLLWNAFFLLQAILLFAGNTVSGASSQESVSAQRKVNLYEWMARAVIGLAIALPIGERFGWFDHWPAWALYAPHSSRVTVEVALTAVSRLPAELQKQVPDTEEGVLWVELPIAKWSLESLSAPIYPQARFQLGVAEFVCNYVEEFEIRALERSSSSRWTGLRANRTHDGASAIRAAANRFWLNAHPRVFSEKSSSGPMATNLQSAQHVR